jgi:ATP:corrinoid adenosyltransferase
MLGTGLVHIYYGDGKGIPTESCIRFPMHLI